MVVELSLNENSIVFDYFVYADVVSFQLSSEYIVAYKNTYLSHVVRPLARSKILT